MATYQAGNKSERKRPYIARIWPNGRWFPPEYLGYYRTRAEAEKAEEEARGKTSAQEGQGTGQAGTQRAGSLGPSGPRRKLLGI